MAYTRELPSGNFQGCYYNALGKVRSAGTYPDEESAYVAALKAENNIRKDSVEEEFDDATPYGKYFTDWLAQRIVAPATVQLYNNTADNHILPTWKGVPLRRIKAPACQRWVSTMHNAGVTPWVIHNAAKIMSASLNAAVKKYAMIPFNPMAYVEVPRVPSGSERYLTPEEVNRITFFMVTKRDKLIVDTLCQTGLRFGELAGLHRSNIDQAASVIKVVQQFDQHAGVIRELKDHDPRTVPVPPELLAEIVAYIDETPWERDTCGVVHADGVCPGGGLLVTGTRGGPLHSRIWGAQVWRPALTLAEIRGRVRPHDLRHTYASWLIQEGVPIPEVALMMGHSTWEMTKRYAHLDPGAYITARDAIQRRRAAPRAASRSLRAVTAPSDVAEVDHRDQGQKAS